MKLGALHKDIAWQNMKYDMGKVLQFIDGFEGIHILQIQGI